MKRKVTEEVYEKMGRPDLGSTIYFKKDGKRIYGKVVSIAFSGFRGAKTGLVQLGMKPFQRFKR